MALRKTDVSKAAKALDQLDEQISVVDALEELRPLIRKKIAQGNKVATIQDVLAKSLGVSPATVRTYIGRMGIWQEAREHEERGKVTPIRKSGNRR